MHLPKKNSLFLGLIFFLFVVKELVFLSILPPFQGPDEQIHYATIQHRTNHDPRAPIINDEQNVNDFKDIRTFHLTEETIESARLMQFDEIKSQKENIAFFTDSSLGSNETTIIKNTWGRSVLKEPSNTSRTQSIYYSLGIQIERFLSDTSFFTRFFALRLLSILFGLGTVLFAYLLAKKIGFSEIHSFFFSIIVAFQPMFSATASIVNIDITLIFSFSLFVLTATSLLKNGLQPLSLFLLLFSLVLGVFSKGPGIVLCVMTFPLLTYLVIEKYHLNARRVIFSTLGIFVILSLSLFITAPNYILSITNFKAISKFDSIPISLSKYADKTLGVDSFVRSHASYWGYFGWLDTKLGERILQIIWFSEIISFIGVLLFLVNKKLKDFLPEKKYVVFFFGMILALQCAIRFFDWRVFDYTGAVLIGTPGRYFLPNILPHFMLVIIGIGFFLKNKHQFNIFLTILSLGMILLSLYATFNVIIPRYYL